VLESTVSEMHDPSLGVCLLGHVDVTALGFIWLPPLVMPKSSHSIGMRSVAMRVVGTVVIVSRSMRTAPFWYASRRIVTGSLALLPGRSVIVAGTSSAPCPTGYELSNWTLPSAST